MTDGAREDIGDPALVGLGDPRVSTGQAMKTD